MIIRREKIALARDVAMFAALAAFTRLTITDMTFKALKQEG